eukprot:1205434-Pyramimonas_sp.AAC.1
MLDSPHVAWTRENAWLDFGTSMLDTLLCGTWFQLRTAMLHTPWAAWTHENTWFQLGTTMSDTPWVARIRENTWLQLGTAIPETFPVRPGHVKKNLVPARGNHIRYPAGRPGHVKTAR